MSIQNHEINTGILRFQQYCHIKMSHCLSQQDNFNDLERFLYNEYLYYKGVYVEIVYSFGICSYRFKAQETHRHFPI